MDDLIQIAGPNEAYALFRRDSQDAKTRHITKEWRVYRITDWKDIEPVSPYFSSKPEMMLLNGGEPVSKQTESKEKTK
jgi:hypothetical protein